MNKLETTLYAALVEADARIRDMLRADDGQAFSEAERALPKIQAALMQAEASSDNRSFTHDGHDYTLTRLNSKQWLVLDITGTAVGEIRLDLAEEFYTAFNADGEMLSQQHVNSTSVLEMARRVVT